MEKGIVEKGYDKIADWYYQDRLKTRGTLRFLKKIKKDLPKEGKVLDIGCGVGYPVAKHFDKEGYSVTGIDISSKMLKIAKEKIPNAKFLKKDMLEMKFPDNSFDIVISILSILHISKKYHKKLFKNIYRILKPNGRIIIGMTTLNDGEYTNQWVKGVKMFWSTSGKEENINLIKDSGFKIIWTKELGPRKDKHIYILAKKEVITK